MLREKGRRPNLPYVLKDFWWVLLFISFTFSGFLFAASSQKKIAVEIQRKIEFLSAQKNEALFEKELLEQKIDSKDDPAYLALTLIQVLGVTPKGQQKVIFNRVD